MAETSIASSNGVTTLTIGLATDRELKRVALRQRLHDALRGAAEDKGRLMVNLNRHSLPSGSQHLSYLYLLSAWCPIISLFLQLTGFIPRLIPSCLSEMRFSTLTLVVFVAHASTLAIAAPLPFTDEVQELVARGDDDPPAASSSGTPIPASARWAQVASSIANKVPAPFVRTNVPSNFVSAVQKAVGAAQNIPGNQNPRHVFPIPAPPSSPAVPKTESMLDRFKQRGASTFDPPTGPILTPVQQVVAQLKKNQAHPVAAASEHLQRGQQARPPGSSTARKSSTGGKAVTGHKASSPGRKATTAHKPAGKASSASHEHKEGKSSQPHKGPREHKAGTAQKVFKGPTRKASVSPKKGKAPKLRKRNLEIDELD